MTVVRVHARRASTSTQVEAFVVAVTDHWENDAKAQLIEVEDVVAELEGIGQEIMIMSIRTANPLLFHIEPPIILLDPLDLGSNFVPMFL